jgi:hypothetical protein
VPASTLWNARTTAPAIFGHSLGQVRIEFRFQCRLGQLLDQRA